jgi:NAD(P)-dependent dehydrogenase (short-subunit alcohol dehydrogenase family)
VLEVDLTDEDSIIKAAKQFGDEKLDILINCAGKNLYLLSFGWNILDTSSINEF